MTTEYCAVSDVQSLINQFTFDNGNVPTTAEVTAWIQQKSAMANAAMARANYATIPATGANDLLILKDMVAKAVALQALYTALRAANVPESDKVFLSGWRDFLKELGDGTIWLPDQQPERNQIRFVRTRVYGKES